MRPFAALGFKSEEASELVDSLNELLASYAVHHQKLWNFHWNVTGSDFFDLHEKFEEQYHHAAETIDAIAERVRVFGHRPTSTMRRYLEMSKIEESGSDLDASTMVKEMLADQSILLEQMFHVLDKSIEHGDSGTEDLMKGDIRYIEQRHWMLTAFSRNN